MAVLTSQPYVQAAMIAAIPATLTALAAWYSTHKGRKESHNDANDVSHQVGQIGEKLNQFDTRFERIDTHFAKMDLRFDSIEDKVERHLGWHRTHQADMHLLEMLTKETPSDVRNDDTRND
jgi:hypothetical protein